MDLLRFLVVVQALAWHDRYHHHDTGWPGRAIEVGPPRRTVTVGLGFRVQGGLGFRLGTAPPQ